MSGLTASKFDLDCRAWSAKKGEMYYSSTPGNVLVLTPERWELGEMDYDWLVYGAGTDFPIDDDVLMLYIGLKDKNGRKIYDGDICQLSNGYVLIEFRNGGFGYLFEMNDSENWISFAGHSSLNAILSRIEVVGNRFENQDLAKRFVTYSSHGK